MTELYIRAFYCIMTIYMMLILLRWFAPHLELDLDLGRIRVVGKAVDPLVKWVRGMLPSLGPFDFGPGATLVLIWLVRDIMVGVLIAAASGSGG